MPLVKLAFYVKCSNFISIIFLSQRIVYMSLFSKLPAVLRNFYVISLLIFLFWMLFLDSNDLISQAKLSSKLKNLEAERAHYLEKIDEVEKDREELLSNSELLEKFAREKYLMRRKTEDLYVIVEKEK